MATEHKMLEISAPSVEEAIERGLDELGMSRSEVTVEIIERPRSGFFGIIGSREATIRIAPVGYQPPAAAPAPIAAEAAQSGSSKESTKAVQTESAPGVSAELDGKKAQVIKFAEQTVVELLEKMAISAEVNAHFVAPEDDYDEELLWVDIEGRDLSILIGHRSETLNALQYIASLIVNKQAGELVPLMVDVQGFRRRREQQIRKLALRMADQCVKTGRRQMLEPMSANERRIVHIALRGYQGVKTESIGESPNRKVTILPTQK